MPTIIAVALLFTIPLAVVTAMLALMLFIGIGLGPIWVYIFR